VLQQLLNRAALTREEVHILRGIARAVARSAMPPQSPASAPSIRKAPETGGPSTPPAEDGTCTGA
jgi:hypothetical protein